MSVAPQATATHDAGSPLAWYDEHLVDDVALYDITRQAASVLSSILLRLDLAAADERDREHWAARRRLVKQQVAALRSGDRAGLAAQQEAWADEIRALDARAVPTPA
ncbi:MAG: hypothetical protein LBS56_08120 [Propionibacteriaceae bacterium]|jgi:hypothetical protein|nr:hypothetical protein [Propionibacteriaceae bacterium]